MDRNPARRPVLVSALTMAMWITSTAGGCAGEDRRTEPPTSGEIRRESPKPADATPCTDPRPEVCTQHYDPVCGERDDGSRQTYSNACAACADTRVGAHRPGDCE